ncbi:MAG: hypothetical protein U0934_13505 [Pseudotabrizicola sp.]|uniref:hypothetical protein n=1 Tax=Pseudotabrizicola sp. TaxID=2939647 RepID=UPI0027317DBF|nr:hypothetical protein [Pseudotabrizicola sp.]MDP2083417.1 hypothetical protein [Pseudotabrizicola sp.]MDZ7574955.1 hypothetical protein [Pseudotabrizicola sp.]
MIDPQDLRTAVQRGLITESQAAGLTGIAESRRQAVAGVEPGEEPFVLFKGFNEIFIVIGLSILFMGWVGVSAVLGAEVFNPGGLDTVLVALVTLGGLAVVQGYCTLTRRMIAPSIALAIMSALTAWVLGAAFADVIGLRGLTASALTSAVVAALMLLHYQRFRVPFDAAIIATAVFSTVWSLLAGAGVLPDTSAGFLHLSGTGSLSVLSLIFGLLTFAFAMRFDMTDPLRVSTRSTTGFWLHVTAAPAIVNTVAVFLLSGGQGGKLVLMVFLLAIALVALAIDRRSFLVSGAGYAVWLIFELFDGSAMVILFLGFGLVFLGAQWERLRSALMRGLPDFPGKTRLPPYGSNT